MALTASTLLDEAFARHRAGDLAGAERLYLQLTHAEPQRPQPWHLLGLLKHGAKDHSSALALIERAIELDASQAIFFNNHGAVLLALARDREAAASFREATRLRPELLDAWMNLGRTVASLGDVDEAAVALRSALQLSPGNSEALQLLAIYEYQQGSYKEAIGHFRSALAANPDSAELYNNLANALFADQQLVEAIDTYRLAISIQPTFELAHYNLGLALDESGQAAEAVGAFDRAAELNPGATIWRLRSSLVCPAVFSSTTELDEYRENLSAVVDRLGETSIGLSGADLFKCGFCPPFGLSFHGRDNRVLKEKFAAIARQCIRPVDAAPHSGKPRIGFVVTAGHERFFIRCMASLIDRLPFDEFDFFVLCSLPAERVLRAGLSNPYMQWAVFAEDFDTAVRVVRQVGCTMLYFWEVGSDPLNYLLPFARLAPVQCTSWSTQVTSGVRELDYYISSDLVESPDADLNYTERLHRLPSLLACLPRLERPSASSEAGMNLPAGRRLYVCPQTILKLHPDQDSIFRDILESDPHGTIVLKEGRHGFSTLQLKQRLQRTLGSLAANVVFVPWQSHEQYLRLLSVADVLLDPVHYSAGSSAYDIFSFNQPVVSLPGELNISRYTQACYWRMGLPELVASDVRNYVERSIRLATDDQHRASIRQQIAERSHVLFDDESFVASQIDFFRQVISKV